MRAQILMVISIASGLWGPVGQGAIYKWVDEDGKVNYSDKPHASASEMTIETNSPPAASPPTDAARKAKQQRLLDAFVKEREEKAAADAQLKDEKLKRRVYCADLNRELLEIEQATYLYDYDENGERVVFSHEQRAAATSAYKEEIRKKC